MGGFGSGRGPRPDAWKSKKLTTDMLPRFSLSDVLAQAKERPVCGEIESVKLCLSDSGIIVAVNLITQPCPLTGRRFVLVCPICDYRVKNLYILRSVLLACRHCLEMRYASQNQTCSYRQLRHLNKIKTKINDDPWTKPKGMHGTTFEKLRRAYFDQGEIHEITLSFSLRNKRSAEAIYARCGSALDAIEILG
jgi:hypothetical protein